MKPLRRPFFILAILLASLVDANAATKPNVLILFTDDQRSDTIAALGNDVIQTPNLDELANRGFNVSSAYCLGANIGAVCRPSRNMLLSGRTYFRWTNPAKGKPEQNAPALDNTLPAVFNAAGYETYHHGKRGNTAQNIHRQFDHSHYLNDFADRWSMEAGKKIVDDALGFLADRNEIQSPWLMYLAFAMPHDPRAASPKALAKYDADSIKLVPGSADVHPFDNGSVIVRDEWTALWPRTDQVLRDQLHDYYAAITTIDENIGRLIEDLRNRGELENTVIVFSSDHGLAMGAHGLMGKQNVYEAGYKAPMVIAGPGIIHGTCDDPVYLMDLFPTLCDLCGLDIPNGLDGRSFASMVSEGASGPRQAVMLSYTDTQRAVRFDGWKLIRYPQINRTQLFHLENDPHELNDISGDAKHSGRIKLLMEKMRELQHQQGDDLALSTAQPSSESFQSPKVRVIHSGTSESVEGDLHATKYVGAESPKGEFFSILRPENGYFVAIAIGHSRTEPNVVSGIRFDVVSGADRDADRRTVVVGDLDARWTPLLDQMRANRQPALIYGAADSLIHRLGIIQSDGRKSPAYGGSGGTDFQVHIPREDGQRFDPNRFAGFRGTILEMNGRIAIESMCLLYKDLKAENTK